eukprot:3180802-Amphidinium_carterae.1
MEGPCPTERLAWRRSCATPLGIGPHHLSRPEAQHLNQIPSLMPELMLSLKRDDSCASQVG